MANSNHLDVLRQGVEVWNKWRDENPDLEKPDLSGADLNMANLNMANFSGADLSGAILRGASLFHANLSEADLLEADLSYCLLNNANFQGSKLTICNVYGISAWDLMVSEKTEQSNLIISSDDADHYVTVDDLEVAQFVYLLLDNRKLRNVIQAMTSKAVLILGNFAPERKEVLDAIRERLRDYDYLPILFDFTGPQNQRFIDTVTTVARLSRFVVADLTQPRSVTAELTAIVEQLPLLPIQPLILKSEEPPHAFITDVVVSDSVLKLYRYTNVQDLLASFDESILDPALKRRDELEVRRLRAIEEKL
jgi:hypothetical protein